LWSGSKYSLSKLDGRGQAIKLGSGTIEPSGHARVLGVIMSSDLSLEKHVSAVSVTCFFISDRFVMSGSRWMSGRMH